MEAAASQQNALLIGMQEFRERQLMHRQVRPSATPAAMGASPRWLIVTLLLEAFS